MPALGSGLKKATDVVEIGSDWRGLYSPEPLLALAR